MGEQRVLPLLAPGHLIICDQFVTSGPFWPAVRDQNAQIKFGNVVNPETFAEFLRLSSERQVKLSERIRI